MKLSNKNFKLLKVNKNKMIQKKERKDLQKVKGIKVQEVSLDHSGAKRIFLKKIKKSKLVSQLTITFVVKDLKKEKKQ